MSSFAAPAEQGGTEGALQGGGESEQQQNGPLNGGDLAMTSGGWTSGFLLAGPQFPYLQIGKLISCPERRRCEGVTVQRVPPFSPLDSLCKNKADLPLTS